MGRETGAELKAAKVMEAARPGDAEAGERVERVPAMRRAPVVAQAPPVTGGDTRAVGRPALGIPADAADPANSGSERRAGGTFAALRVPNYRRFISGQIVSMCGTWMQTIALGWLVLSLGASGTMLGVVTATQFLPILLLGAYGGLVADRSNTRKLLITTASAQATLAAVLGVLVLSHAVSLWMVIVFAALQGLAQAADNPARQSFVQEMVGPDTLPNAVTLNSVTINAARVVGPAFAGAIITFIGTGMCFILNAASFAAVILALVRLDQSALRPKRRLTRAPGQIREGFRYAVRTPGIRIPLMMMVITGTLAYEFQVTLPLVARETFHGTAATYSLLTGAMGAGAVVGGLLVARRRLTGVPTLVAVAAAFGVLILVAAAAPSLVLAVAALVLTGAGSVALISTGNATVQLAADPAMRGRVMALWSMAFVGTTPVGGPIAGAVAQALGARAGLVLAGAAALASALIGLLSLRAIADRESAAAPAAARLTAASPANAAKQIEVTSRPCRPPV